MPAQACHRSIEVAHNALLPPWPDTAFVLQNQSWMPRKSLTRGIKRCAGARESKGGEASASPVSVRRCSSPTLRIMLTHYLPTPGQPSMPRKMTSLPTPRPAHRLVTSTPPPPPITMRPPVFAASAASATSAGAAKAKAAALASARSSAAPLPPSNIFRRWWEELELGTAEIPAPTEAMRLRDDAGTLRFLRSAMLQSTSKAALESASQDYGAARMTAFPSPQALAELSARKASLGGRMYLDHLTAAVHCVKMYIIYEATLDRKFAVDLKLLCQALPARQLANFLADQVLSWADAFLRDMDNKMSSKMILRAYHDFAWYCLFVPVLPARRPRNYTFRAELVRIVTARGVTPQIPIAAASTSPDRIPDPDRAIQFDTRNAAFVVPEPVTSSTENEQHFMMMAREVVGDEVEFASPEEPSRVKADKVASGSSEGGTGSWRLDCARRE